LLAAKLFARPAEELAPALPRAQLFGELVAARFAVELVLGLVGCLRLGEDLARYLPELVVCLRARVARDPCAVDRHHAGLQKPRPGAVPEHLAEEVGERLFVAAEKARDRGVIGDQAAGDHPVGDVPAAVALDRPRGALLGRVGVEHKRDHRLRLIGRAAMASAR